MSCLLQRSSGRYLLHHPWMFGLSILGVALGVAVITAIDIANVSAEKAFELSARRVTGSATHQITGTAGGLDEEVYRKLRVEYGVRPAAPVVQGYAEMERRGRTLQILGIDPLADAPFRPYAGSGGDLDLSAFMAQGAAALLAEPTARELSVVPGDSLQLSVNGRIKSVAVVGLIHPADEYSSRVLENLLLVDIATAQHLLEMNGELSRIDLIIPEGEEGARQLEYIEGLLPSDAQLVRSSARTETVQQMTRAFELNLSALSMLALIVGMFLIYNTMTFSVVQRRSLLGRLRALGVTRKELFTTVLGEAALIGLIGTVLGLLLGWVLATFLVRLVTRTINDLYYVVSVRELTVSLPTLAKGIGMGIGATVLTAAVPAYEAASARITEVLQRSREESSTRAYLPWLTVAGVLLGCAAAALTAVSGQNLVVSYIALFLVLAGFALITPVLVIGWARLVRPLMEIVFGVVGRMSARALVTTLSRTSVAVAALTVAVAATVGVGVMVDSFRSTVVVWLDNTLQADIYVQPSSAAGRRGEAVLDAELVDLFQDVPGVVDAHTIRRLEITSEFGTANLAAVDHSEHTRRTIRFKERTSDAIWTALGEERVVLVSEPFSYRHDLRTGDTLRLRTRGGNEPFRIGGVYYDYGSGQGTVLMSRQIFEQYYEDPGAAGLALYTAPDVPVEDVVRRLRAVERDQEVAIQSNRALREASMNVFDRTFTITTVLRLLAIIVAFIGVLTALMALQLERIREVGVLRANGMTPGQVGRYVSLQTGLMGLVSGLLAVPLGLLLAVVLVFVINKRSFGWSLQFTASPEILLQAVLLAVAAAILAGVYPAWKMATAKVAEALRE